MGGVHRPAYRTMHGVPVFRGLIVTFRCRGCKGGPPLLQAWNVGVLAFSAGLASLSLLRGGAGLIVATTTMERLEAAALLLAGIGGWLGAAMLFHRPV